MQSERSNGGGISSKPNAEQLRKEENERKEID